MNTVFGRLMMNYFDRSDYKLLSMSNENNEEYYHKY